MWPEKNQASHHSYKEGNMSFPSWPGSIDPNWYLYWWFTNPQEPHPNPHGPNPMMSVRPAVNPGPNPWMVAVSIIFEAVNAKQVASSLPEGELRTQLEARAEGSIEQVLDDWCGTRPPWSWPGPPPWVAGIASQLAALANSVQAAPAREELLRIAGQALERSIGPASTG
jgi:hypothetical protein